MIILIKREESSTTTIAGCCWRASTAEDYHQLLAQQRNQQLLSQPKFFHVCCVLPPPPKWIVWSNWTQATIWLLFQLVLNMALDEEPENVIVPGQGLRRVIPLSMVSAIGFSGKFSLFSYVWGVYGKCGCAVPIALPEGFEALVNFRQRGYTTLLIGEIKNRSDKTQIKRFYKGLYNLKALLSQIKAQ